MFKNFFKRANDEDIFETVDPIVEQRRNEKFSKPLIYDEEFKKDYYAMTQAVSDEVYIENCKKLQKYMADTIDAQALCWETAFFPYRTDKYTGWNNYPSWGVINSTTWFELTAK